MGTGEMESGEEGTPGVPRDQQSIPTFLHWAVHQVLVSGCHRPVDRSSLEGSSLSGLTRGGCRPSWRGRQGHGKLEAASHISLTARKKRDACRCPLPIFIMCVYVFEHVYACPCAYRHPQKPEEGVCWGTCEHFQAAMNRLMWVLGTELWSSIKSSRLSHLSRPYFLLLI